MTRFICPLVALLLLAGAGMAQTLQFRDLGRGATGPLGEPRNLVARSQASFDAQGMDLLLNTAAEVAPIDWSQEMVVAILLGTRDTAGYAIEIVEIARNRIPGSFMPRVFEVVVKYRISSPRAGSSMSETPTGPYHMVRLPQFPHRVHFERLAPAASPVFDSARLEYDRGPTGEGVRIAVRDDGQVIVQRDSPVRGTATPDELVRLRQAIAGARAASLPTTVQAAQHMPRFRLTVSSERPQFNGSTTGTLGHYDRYDARIRPLIDALKVIGERVLQESGHRLTGRIELPPGEGVRLIDSSGGLVGAVSGR